MQLVKPSGVQSYHSIPDYVYIPATCMDMHESCHVVCTYKCLMWLPVWGRCLDFAMSTL